MYYCSGIIIRSDLASCVRAGVMRIQSPPSLCKWRARVRTDSVGHYARNPQRPFALTIAPGMDGEYRLQ
jgi:hypothetical protein